MTEPERQSTLSEAVEQAARTGSMWWDDLTQFAEEQADRVASGHYGLTDLTTAQVGLLRIWFKNSTNVVRTTIDNIAMLAYDGPTGGPVSRTVQVAVPVPAQLNADFLVSDLVSPNYRITAATKLRLAPLAAPAQQAPRDVPVTVTVNCAGAPAGTYRATIYTTDGSVNVPFLLAIDEIGTPLR